MQRCTVLFRLLVSALLLAVTGASASADSRERVALIAADPQRTQVLAAELRMALPAFQVDTLAADDARLGGYAMAITLKEADADYVGKTHAHLPVIAVSGTLQGCENLMRTDPAPAPQSPVIPGKLACITTTPPPKYFLALVKMLHPTVGRALVLLPQGVPQLDNEFRAAAGEIDVALEVVEYAGITNIFKALETTVPGTIVIPVSDPAIYNRQSLKAILDVSYNSNIGLIGYSQGFAAAGALGAVFNDGRSTALEIARAVLDFKTNGQFTQRRRTPSVSVTLNSAVAQSLNLIEPSQEAIAARVRALEGN